MKLLGYNRSIHEFRMERNCRDCHREVPHGRINSLSSVPWARIPLPGSAVPDWRRRDYNQGRGHYYAVKDVQKTLRTGAPSATVPSPQPNTCWTC